MEFVQFLQNPAKFKNLGAKLPKGENVRQIDVWVEVQQAQASMALCPLILPVRKTNKYYGTVPTNK
jgi:hypothetical protein